MVGWTARSKHAAPEYKALPPGNRQGSRAAIQGRQIYTCGGGSGGDMRICYSTEIGGQRTWTTSTFKQLKVNVYIKEDKVIGDSQNNTDHVH